MNTMVFWLSSLAVPAIWIFGLVFRKRDLLIVHTKRGGRRLIFHGSGEPNEIAAFLDNAATSFGYRLGPPT